ncbi:hypothetical protein ACHAW5_009184 [Stephanodiscus triporus]|uniref:SMODS and SLOG-associating 2TM effector domain-containing protein n=1 Tax=Stephanodiscus triporus TaxID=2934178 RepID=A0ABD3PY53_9STRA
MPSVQSDAGANDRNVLGEKKDDNNDGEGNQVSSTARLAPDGVIHEAEPVRVCLLDSYGNQTNISTREHLKAAAALLKILDKRIGLGLDEETEVFPTTIDTPQKALLDEVKRFELFRSVIQHEDDLLNQRVSWIILAQSFLVAAFISNTSEDGSRDGDAMKFITAIVGLSTVIVTLPAILAAGRNIELQQQVYFSGIITEERCLELHGHGRRIMQCAGKKGEKFNMKEEQMKRLSEGHILPNMSFRGRGTVPILVTVMALSTVQVLGWLFLLTALLKGW